MKDGRRIVGGLGSCLDSVLCALEQRKCRIIGKDFFAERYENGSYSETTGVLAMLKQESIDLYLKGESQTIELPWLKSTNPFKVEGFYIGHRIFKTDNVQYFDVVLNINLGLNFYVYFISFLLLSLLSCFAVISLTNCLKAKRIKLKSVFVNNILHRRPLKLSSVGLLLYALNLFLNFCQLCVLNEIQSDKIVVDTSELIQSDHDVLSTDKIACLVKEEIETNIFSENSLIQQLIDWKSKFRKKQTLEKSVYDTGKCWLTKSVPLQLFDSKVFFVGTQIFELSLYYAYSLLGRDFKGWRYSKPVHEANRVLYYSRRNPGNDQFAKEV